MIFRIRNVFWFNVSWEFTVSHISRSNSIVISIKKKEERIKKKEEEEKELKKANFSEK